MEEQPQELQHQQQQQPQQQEEGDFILEMLEKAKEYISKLLKEKKEIISHYQQLLDTAEDKHSKTQEEKNTLERTLIGYQFANECLEEEKKSLTKENADLKKALKESQEEVRGVEYELKQSEQLWRDLSNQREDEEHVDLDMENSRLSGSAIQTIPAIPPKPHTPRKVNSRNYLANLPPAMNGEDAMKKRKAKDNKINEMSRLHKEARHEAQRTTTPESRWGTHSTPPMFQLK